MIRKATTGDIDAIIQLGSRLVNSGAFAHTNVSYRACVDRLVTAIRSPNQWLGVALHEGKVVGFLLLQVVSYWWSTNDRYVLDDGIYCERPLLGRALVREGLYWASRQRGVCEVMIALNSRIKTERSALALSRIGFKDRGIVVSIPKSNFPVAREVQLWAVS